MSALSHRLGASPSPPPVVGRSVIRRRSRSGPSAPYSPRPLASIWAVGSFPSLPARPPQLKSAAPTLGAVLASPFCRHLYCGWPPLSPRVTKKNKKKTFSWRSRPGRCSHSTTLGCVWPPPLPSVNFNLFSDVVQGSPSLHHSAGAGSFINPSALGFHSPSPVTPACSLRHPCWGHHACHPPTLRLLPRGGFLPIPPLPLLASLHFLSWPFPLLSIPFPSRLRPPTPPHL